MNTCFAFQLTLNNTAQQLPGYPVGQGIWLGNIAASQGTVIVIASSSGNTVTANVMETTGNTMSDINNLYIPMPGGNTNQLWVKGPNAQILTVIGV